MLVNAKNEFLQALGNHKVLCASLQYVTMQTSNGELSYEEEACVLPVGHSQAQFQEFLDWLDFSYQNTKIDLLRLSGTVWLTTDGVWMERTWVWNQECFLILSRPLIPDNILLGDAASL